MMLVHSCCSARLSAPFPLSRSVHRSRHKQLAGRSPPRANAAEQEETALARESGLQAKLYPEGRGSPGLTSSDELRALLKNRPAYKQWVQRWWTASAPVAIELLLSLPEADVNVTDDRGETKLLQAARLAQLDIVKVLLKNGADPNIVKGFDMNEEWANLSCRVRMPEDAIRLQSKSNHDAALHVAINTGGVEMVRALCDGGANVDARTKWDNTPLMVAARLGAAAVIRELLARGARAEDTNTDGHTALHFAASRGSVDSVQALVAAGAAVNARDLDCLTPLYFASMTGSALCVRELLAAGAKPSEARHRELGFTPLIAAVQRADADSIRLLCGAGADLAARDAGSRTVMHWAGEKGTIECVRVLTIAGADPNARDRDGNSALHYASRAGNLEAVVALVDALSDPSAVNALGLTPLMLAAAAGYLEIARALLVAGAQTGMRDEFEATALHYAVGYSNAITLRSLLANRGGDAAGQQMARTVWQQPIVSADDSSHLSVVKELLAAGADANAADRHGDAAIATACQNAYQNCASALLEAGAFPGPTTGRSPMSYAARFGAAGCIRVLRKFNAEVSSAGAAWSPLHDAADAGYVECVRALLDIGASVNAFDEEKQTPLHAAARRGHSECARELLLASAVVDARNSASETPLIVASKAGHVEVVRALMEAGAEQSAADTTGRNAMAWASKAAVRQQLRAPSQRIALIDDIRTRLASAETLAAMRAAYTEDQASALERERRAKEEALAELAEMKAQMKALRQAGAAPAQQPQAHARESGGEASEQAGEEVCGIISGGYGA